MSIYHWFYARKLKQITFLDNINKRTRFMGTLWGCTLLSIIAGWGFGVQGTVPFTLRYFVPEKWLKYIPYENGGNILFPFAIMTTLGLRGFYKTHWASFDQKSFFPHSDEYKMKVAICQNDFELASSVINQKFDINSQIDRKQKYSSLCLAAQLGRIEMIEYLVSRGADINQKDFEGNTPLMLAVIHDQSESIKTLVSLGANLSEKDRYGYTALNKAESRGLENIVEFLSNDNKIKEKILVNPVTHMLESYEYFSKEGPSEIAKKYQVNRYFNGEIYPYFKNTQGMLLYIFGGFDNKDIEKQCVGFNWFNKQDEKHTSDQEIFSFIELAAEGGGMGLKKIG